MELVPVHCEAYGGLGDLHGVLQFDGDKLVLRYQTADSLFGVMRSEAKRLEFSLPDITQVQYRPGWFWLMPLIEVSLTDFEALAQLPIEHGGCLRLRVKFSHRRAAARLVDSLGMAASEQRFRRLDDELARMTRPPQASAPAGAAQAVPPPPPGQSVRPPSSESE